MVNNFELIKNFVEFENGDDFFFVQCLKRRKENPEMLTDVINIDNFYIKSKEDFDKYGDRIIEICDRNRARAYIRLNRRSFKKIAHKTNLLIAGYLEQEDYRAVPKAYLSACGQFNNETNKKWILDLDLEHLPFINDVKEFLDSVKAILYLEVPTKNGIHLITSGFNPISFNKIYPTIEIKKDQPTILYSI
jgi:hypothetical protein